MTITTYRLDPQENMLSEERKIHSYSDGTVDELGGEKYGTDFDRWEDCGIQYAKVPENYKLSDGLANIIFDTINEKNGNTL